MSIANTGLGGDPMVLAVSPRRAGQMTGYGLTRVYELINSGEWESFKDGKSRRVIVASMRAYIARQVAATKADAA